MAFPKLRGCFILAFCVAAHTASRLNSSGGGGTGVGVENLFGKSERIVVLAADHRYFGVVSGLEKPCQVLSPLLEFVDVLMTDPGVLRNEFGGQVSKPV